MKLGLISDEVSYSNDTLWKKWIRCVDGPSLVALMIVIFFGLIMTITASTAVAERIGISHFHFILRQIFFVSLSVPVIFVISTISQKSLYKMGLIGFFIMVLLLSLLPYFGEEIKGAKRWINILGFSVQPSELIKPFYAIVIAVILGAEQKIGRLLGFVICFILHCFVCILLIVQPDLGMTITISIVTITQMFIAGLSWFIILFLFSIFILGLIIAYFTLPHVAQRISAFVNGGVTKTNGYQIHQSLESYINGGLFGKGFGEGNTKYLLPDSHTDFIFAVAGEEFGSVICLVIIFLIAFIVVRGILNLITLRTACGVQATQIYIGIGMLVYFAFQSVFNIGVTLHMFPTKGMTLPFVSYGGSAMLSSAIIMGVYFNIVRKRNIINNKIRSPFVKLL